MKACDICARRRWFGVRQCALPPCEYKLCQRCVFLYFQTSTRKVCPLCRREKAFVLVRKKAYPACLATLKPYARVSGYACCFALGIGAAIFLASAIGNVISCIFGFLCFGEGFFSHGIMVFAISALVVGFIAAFCCSSEEND